jgi:hypothetical protein
VQVQAHVRMRKRVWLDAGVAGWMSGCVQRLLSAVKKKKKNKLDLALVLLFCCCF